MSRSGRLLGFAVLAAAAASASCGGGTSAERPIGVLGAFPAELAAVLAHATVDETRTIDGHVFRVGRIGSTPVVMGMTGIGLVNASETTKVLLENFDLRGVVVSGVSAGLMKVGDVFVPETWLLDDDSSYACDPRWLEEAADVTQAGEIALDNCAAIPEVAPPAGVAAGERVCFPYTPRVVVGGFGRSSDPYNGVALGCTPNGNDVFGCDSESLNATSASNGEVAPAMLVRVEPNTQVTFEQETAAIARETISRGLKFIAFRSASDGGDDPLNLTDYIEFFAYYRLASYNAAAAAAAFVARND